MPTGRDIIYLNRCHFGWLAQYPVEEQDRSWGGFFSFGSRKRAERRAKARATKSRERAKRYRERLSQNAA